jgi:two-component system, sensor histidine kinase and response regulator
MAAGDLNQTKSILVIDDELGIREGCRRVLEPSGFNVETAATLQEGLDQIRSHEFDVVLLDVMMPDGRGFDLLDPIREKDPDTIPIIITGYATVELAVEAIKAGAYDFISKPFSPDILRLTVNQGLERRQLSLAAKRLAVIEEESAELAQAKREAERLSEFKTAFTFKVAHELRAPVAGAISLIRPLMRGLAGQLNERQQDILTRIDNRLDILLELVNDLLDLAATKTVISQEALENITLQPIIQEVLDRLSVEADAKKISITIEEPAGNLTVKATKKGLSTIFSNVLGNAIKYTPEAGCVQVRIAGNDGRVLVLVSDTGLGIPAEDLPRIGDEFFRAKNVRRSAVAGTGLGLSIVKELMNNFGGSIGIDSVEGQGTTISLQWPGGDAAAG